MGMDKISIMISEGLLTNTNTCKAFLDRIQGFGISGVEILLAKRKNCYCNINVLSNFAEELLKRNMQIPCVDLYVNYLQPGHFDETCRIVDRMIAAAGALASPLGMICGSVLPDGMEPDKGREIVAQGIDRAIKTGRKKKIDIAIESFGMSWNLQSTTDRLADLYGKLKEGPCFFVGDLGNPCYGGETPIISLQKFSDKLKHVHVKDVKKTKPGKGSPTSGDYWLDAEKLGRGIADIPGSLRFLNQERYSGWYSLELNWRNNLKIIGQYSSALKRLLKTA